MEEKDQWSPPQKFGMKALFSFKGKMVLKRVEQTRRIHVANPKNLGDFVAESNATIFDIASN